MTQSARDQTRFRLAVTVVVAVFALLGGFVSCAPVDSPVAPAEPVATAQPMGSVETSPTPAVRQVASPTADRTESRPKDIPTAQSNSPLIIEEYPIVDRSVDSPGAIEYFQRIDQEILEKRRPWREDRLSEERWLTETNLILSRFGYSLSLQLRQPFEHRRVYELHYHDAPVLQDVAEVRPIVGDQGDEFALLVDDSRYRSFIVRSVAQGGAYTIDRWDSAQHCYIPPVFVEGKLVAVRSEDHRGYTVQANGEVLHTFHLSDEWVDPPVKSLWSWKEQWVIEVRGEVVIDGNSVNEELGYGEIFHWALVDRRPFYFFRSGETIGMSYHGQVMPVEYDEVIHYQCCEPAAFNVRSNETMVWFHARRGDIWYYVEAGIYDQPPGIVVEPAEPSEEAAEVRKQIHITETGLTFEIPEGWRQVDQEMIWSQSTNHDLSIGFNWVRIQPGVEIEAVMLPNNALVLDSHPVELHWGSGRSYLVEVYAPDAQHGETQAIEMHVIVRTEDSRAYGFYASARNREDLAKIEPVLEHVIDSVKTAGK